MYISYFLYLYIYIHIFGSARKVENIHIHTFIWKCKVGTQMQGYMKKKSKRKEYVCGYVRTHMRCEYICGVSVSFFFVFCFFELFFFCLPPLAGERGGKRWEGDKDGRMVSTYDARFWNADIYIFMGVWEYGGGIYIYRQRGSWSVGIYVCMCVYIRWWGVSA